LAPADFDTAIRFAPDFALAFFDRAETHKAVRNYERAIKDYDVYVSLDPSDIDGYIHRAFAHRQLQDYPEAIADPDEAVRLQPKDSRVLNLRCWVRAVAGVEL
jgi:tetratricopeptide (TPR) repeat protein